MKQIVKYVLILFGILIIPDAMGMIPEAYQCTTEGDEDKIYCIYNQHLFTFEILDNRDGKYSMTWPNVVKAVLPTSLRSWTGDVSFPESMMFEGIEYKMIGMSESIKSASNVQNLGLPYELLFIEENAVQDEKGINTDLTDLTLPPALRHVGKNAFSDLPHISDITCHSPMPPACMTSQDCQVEIGDEYREDVHYPFSGTDTHSVLHVPVGFKFFYTQHPAFQSFDRIVEEAIFPWMVKIIEIPGARLGLVYLGNGELMIHDGEVVGYNVDSITIPSTVEAFGTTCRIVGIGRNGLNYFNVKTINLPETIRFLGDRAFWKSEVEEIVLPATCLFAGYKAFSATPNLKRVVLKTTEKPVFAENAFDEIPNDLTLITSADIDPMQAPWTAFQAIEKAEAGISNVWKDNFSDGVFNLNGTPAHHLQSGSIYLYKGKKVMIK